MDSQHSPSDVTQPPVVSSLPSNWLAITALVLGILALLAGWVPFLGWTIVVAAIIFGILGLKKSRSKAMAVAGIVTGSLGGLIAIGVIVSAFLSITRPDVGVGNRTINESLSSLVGGQVVSIRSEESMSGFSRDLTVFVTLDAEPTRATLTSILLGVNKTTPSRFATIALFAEDNTGNSLSLITAADDLQVPYTTYFDGITIHPTALAEWVRSKE